jgi:hypothetical protein
MSDIEAAKWKRRVLDVLERIEAESLLSADPLAHLDIIRQHVESLIAEIKAQWE